MNSGYQKLAQTPTCLHINSSTFSHQTQLRPRPAPYQTGASEAQQKLTFIVSDMTFHLSLTTDRTHSLI